MRSIDVKPSGARGPVDTTRSAPSSMSIGAFATKSVAVKDWDIQRQRSLPVDFAFTVD